MPIIGEWSQTVAFASGPANAVVRDLSIRKGANQRVTECTFTCEDSPAGQASFDACVLGESLTVVQQHGSSSMHFAGDIISVSDERGSNWTQRKVKAYSLEARAKWVRFQAEYDARADSIVTQAWNAHGSGIAPGGISVDSNSQNVELTSAFDSLFDLMEKVCRRTGWAWRIDAQTGVMEFFDPLSRNSPAFDQSAGDIEGETLRVSRDASQVVNVARTPVWLYRRRNKTVKALAAGDCVKSARAKDMLPPPGWELVGEPEIVEDFAPDGFDREVSLTEDGWLEFDPPIIPEDQAETGSLFLQLYAEVEVEVTWRRQVWMILEAADSIAEYGRREGQPIADDGGQTEDEGEQRLTEFLARHAYPTIKIRGNGLRVGYEPDTICNVSLLEPPLSAPLYVTSVSHTTEANDLEVQLEFESPDEVLDTGTQQRPASAEVDVIDEMHRRIIQLERRDAHPLGVLGITTSEVGSLKPSDSDRGGWGWAARISTSEIGQKLEEAWGWGERISYTLPNVNNALAPSGSTGWNEETTAWNVSLESPADPWGWTFSISATKQGGATELTSSEVNAAEVNALEINGGGGSEQAGGGAEATAGGEVNVTEVNTVALNSGG